MKMKIRAVIHLATWLLAAAAAPASWAQSGGKSGMGDPVSYYFPGYDANGDGGIDRNEWGRRGNFDLLDTNHDGVIDRNEFAALYKHFGKDWQPTRKPAKDSAVQIDPSYATDLQDLEAIGKANFCIVARKNMPLCQQPAGSAPLHGLQSSGIGPVFPPNVHCLAIDEGFADG